MSMKSILNRIVKGMSTVIFVILVVLIVAILGYVLRVKYLASTGRLGDIKFNFYTILTQSMVPTIYAGDVIITYKNDDNKYEIGDIVTYRSDLNGGINITHRVKESYVVNGKYSYKTKGDNNSIADSEIVKGERVLGKVVLKIPKVGYFQQYLVNNRKVIIGVLLASLAVVIYDVVKIFEGIRRKDDEDTFINEETEQDNIIRDEEEYNKESETAPIVIENPKIEPIEMNSPIVSKKEDPKEIITNEKPMEIEKHPNKQKLIEMPREIKEQTEEIKPIKIPKEIKNQSETNDDIELL